VDLVGPSGKVVLSTSETTVDLLTLASEVAVLVKDAVVPARTYDQLRMVITGGYVDAGGAIYASSPTYPGLPPEAVVTGPLRMPSFGQSGLKVILPGGLTIGTDAKVLVLDFDVSQSFGHAAGNSVAWVMHPVVKASEVTMTGSIEVTLALGPEVSLPAEVSLADFRAAVVPVAGGDETVVALADRGDGTFGASFRFLSPGDYSVTFLAPDAVAALATDPPVPAIVAVASGTSVTAPFLLTSVTAQGP